MVLTFTPATHITRLIGWSKIFSAGLDEGQTFYVEEFCHAKDGGPCQRVVEEDVDRLKREATTADHRAPENGGAYSFMLLE